MKLAQTLSKDFSQEKTENFLKKFKNLEFIEDVKLLYRMITDKKFSLDPKTYGAIAGAIAYVVLPADVIPDFLPALGFIDDAFVVSMLIERFKDEIERYKSLQA